MYNCLSNCTLNKATGSTSQIIYHHSSLEKALNFKSLVEMKLYMNIQQLTLLHQAMTYSSVHFLGSHLLCKAAFSAGNPNESQPIG